MSTEVRWVRPFFLKIRALFQLINKKSPPNDSNLFTNTLGRLFTLKSIYYRKHSSLSDHQMFANHSNIWLAGLFFTYFRNRLRHDFWPFRWRRRDAETAPNFVSQRPKTPSRGAPVRDNQIQRTPSLPTSSSRGSRPLWKYVTVEHCNYFCSCLVKIKGFCRDHSLK